MDEDQDFEEFLREWAKERIWRTHDVLLQDLMAEARALELIQLAMARGFRDDLMEIQRGGPLVQARCQPGMTLPARMRSLRAALVGRQKKYWRRRLI